MMRNEAGSGSGSGRGRFAPKKGVIDMVGVASSAILGRRGLPAVVTTTSSFSSSSSISSSSSSSSFSSLPLAATAAATTTLFVAFALLPVASEGHPCVPLYRVTFGLRAQPNLPGGRPGPPFSTNPGNELRGSRGLLVAMATEPSPNPLGQTPIPYPSVYTSLTLFRHPLVVVARVVHADVLARKNFSDILVCLSLTDRKSSFLSTLFDSPRALVSFASALFFYCLSSSSSFEDACIKSKIYYSRFYI